MKQESQILIGTLMLVGALISAALALLGGVAYLMQHGNEIVHYEIFNPSIARVSYYFSPSGLINLGIFTLVLTQLLRVALVAWLFVKEKDWTFVLFSVFVLIVLISSFYA